MSNVAEHVREMFKKADDIRDAGLITPDTIERFDNICYGTDEKWQVLDVYRPKDKKDVKLPVIVSVHGGGWVYGDKERYQYYCMSLAQHGFAVINFTYRLSPEFVYPAAIEDTNLVMTWIMNHAKAYHLDTEHIFAVGDSAGAHNLGLYACICTNPEYAKEYSFKVPKGLQLKAIALNCGAYCIDISKNDLTTQLMDVYLPEHGTEREIFLINLINHITENFIPTFFMTCTGDFLINEAPILEKKLIECQIPHEFHFYAKKGQELGHVFHLNIKLDIANQCNKDECDYFKKFL